jgi:hypothetical protein
LGEHLNGCRFARAAGPQVSQHFIWLDGEAYEINDSEDLELLGNTP